MSETLFEMPTVQAASFAILSECERYRYVLGRRWDDGEPLQVVMLNPSTADAEADDPTIRKVRGFAKVNGFNAFEVRNLFAWRATSPTDIDPYSGVGPENDDHLRAIPHNSTVVVAWGSFPYERNGGFRRVQEVLKILEGRKLVCVKQSGVRPVSRPWHPLYVKYGPFEDFRA